MVVKNVEEFCQEKSKVQIQNLLFKILLKSRKKKSDPKGWMIYDMSVPHFMKEMEKKGWSVISTDMAGIGTTMIPNVLVHIYFRKD